MKLDISISNFGKIKRANLKIRPFTVIAGRNSTGKSFITKALYSFFSIINKDHITIEARIQVERLHRTLVFLRHSINNPSLVIIGILDNIEDSILSIRELIEVAFGGNTFTDQLASSFALKDDVDKLKVLISNLQAEVSGKLKYKRVLDNISALNQSHKILRDIVENPSKVTSDRISAGFSDSLKENFQVASIGNLKCNGVSNSSEVRFDFDTLGNIAIKGETISFSLHSNSVDEFQNLFNVVYLESPIYWKMKDALDILRRRSFYMPSKIRGKEALTGVPKHFYDLIDLINTKVKHDESEEIELNCFSNIDKEVGGEFVISESGDMNFRSLDKKSEIGINLTASGITNIGIISLLIKRNVISRGSFIFIDEPEVNLHPAWQRVMVETLYELSKNGINVVIASHSIDMLKCIENVMSDEDDIFVNEHFAINKLNANGISENDGEALMKKMSEIKADLGKPFLEMFMESGL